MSSDHSDGSELIKSFIGRWSEITAERMGSREVLASIVGDIVAFECVHGRVMVATVPGIRRPPAPSEELALHGAILQGHLEIVERDFGSDRHCPSQRPLLRATGSYQIP